MNEREARLGRIEGVIDVYRAAIVAASLLGARLAANPSFLVDSGLRGRVFRDFREDLETTYFLRLFAEFEAGLRDVWRNSFGRQTEPPMRDLLDAIGARRKIPREWVADADRMRILRNDAIHQARSTTPPASIDDARHILRRYFGRMAANW